MFSRPTRILYVYVVSEEERTLAIKNLLKNDGETVHVGFLEFSECH